VTVARLRAFYLAGDEIVLDELPAGTARLRARRADGEVVEVATSGGARLGGLEVGTYSVEAVSAGGEIIAEELTTVARHQGERPVLGFATSFDDSSVAPVLDWLAALRCTVVQVYDWMAGYSQPLGAGGRWTDPLGRPVSAAALRALTAGVRAAGAVAEAYAPVCAADPAFAAAHPELLLYRNDGRPQHLGDLLTIADPGNVEWQRRWCAGYGEAADALGFDGFHLDTYGYPRQAVDREGARVEMRAAYSSFLAAVRADRAGELISFNQVNAVPARLGLPAGPKFRYVEAWPPNDGWRHLEALLDRADPEAGGRAGRGALACYPPVWGVAERTEALRTVTSTEAVATSLGASLLVYGDRSGVLRHPYYPDYEPLAGAEAAEALRWRRFGLRCRDLFLDGEDTSWTEIGDENGSVTVAAAFDVHPEPAGAGVFVRVARHERWVAVSVVDLSGNDSGRWAAPTPAGRCRAVTVKVLVARPEAWQAAAAVLGMWGDRFTPLGAEVVEHREGRAVAVELPLAAGWSVLRLTHRRPAEG
jgi:dextranase